ncbi:MAG TPA: AbrB/MazE/SpoVT family DNA-binding domain-containing protein [Trichormus sp.]|jgi:antitoxin component of MazEF toxin-antitoxin module
MIKNLIKHGNSHALVIDKAVMDLLHIEADTPLEVTTDGENLLIRPIRDKKSQKRISDSLAKFDGKYAAVFKKLAE